MQPINNQEAIAMSQPRTSLSNRFTLACMQYTHAGMQVHALSNVQNTHKHTLIQAQVCLTAKQTLQVQ